MKTIEVTIKLPARKVGHAAKKLGQTIEQYCRAAVICYTDGYYDCHPEEIREAAKA